MYVIRAFIFGWVCMWVAAFLVYSDTNSERGRIGSADPMRTEKPGVENKQEVEKTIGIEVRTSTA